MPYIGCAFYREPTVVPEPWKSYLEKIWSLILVKIQTDPLSIFLQFSYPPKKVDFDKKKVWFRNSVILAAVYLFESITYTAENFQKWCRKTDIFNGLELTLFYSWSSRMAIRAAIEFSVPFAQFCRTCSTISFHSERVSIQYCLVSPPLVSGASGQVGTGMVTLVIPLENR